MAMARKSDQKKGIFCLEESGWFGFQDKTTVEPVLRLLEEGLYGVPYLHRDVGTREEFYFHLRKWRGRSFSRYPILYLGFHGSRGGIRVGEGRSSNVTLAKLYGDDCLGKRCGGTHHPFFVLQYSWRIQRRTEHVSGSYRCVGRIRISQEGRLAGIGSV